jgi:hypothetical protein
LETEVRQVMGLELVASGVEWEWAVSELVWAASEVAWAVVLVEVWAAGLVEAWEAQGCRNLHCFGTLSRHRFRR